MESIERTTALITNLPNAELTLTSALRSMGLTPPKLGRFTEAGGLLLARLVPNQLLAMRSGVDVPLMDELAPLRAIAGLVDLSDARIGIRVQGPNAVDRLGKLLPLDLHPSHFAPGQCAITLMAHLSVIVLQHATNDYELQCGRSFATSFMNAVGLLAA